MPCQIEDSIHDFEALAGNKKPPWSSLKIFRENSFTHDLPCQSLN